MQSRPLKSNSRCNKEASFLNLSWLVQNYMVQKKKGFFKLDFQNILSQDQISHLKLEGLSVDQMRDR